MIFSTLTNSILASALGMKGRTVAVYLIKQDPAPTLIGRIDRRGAVLEVSFEDVHMHCMNLSLLSAFAQTRVRLV